MTREAELEALCRSCGLCCDGALFGRVELQPDEVEPARRHRLHVVAGGKAFEQPCSALVRRDGDAVCAAYDERPRACRRFVCRLYERHRREGGPLEARLAAVARVRSLLASLDGSREAPAELTQRLEEDFAEAR